ncbi:MAG: STAS domain-containing protein [Spirochaetia bacterium]
MNNDIVPGFDDEKTEGLRIQLQRIEDVPGCLLLYLTGYIDTYNSNYFQKCVAKAIDTGYIRLIFDIAHTGTISSVEIGCYTAFLKAIKPKGGDLVLLRMKPKTYEVYQLLGFSNFFNIKENLDEAISFFTASRKQDKRDIFPNILNETERIIKPILKISPKTFSGIPEPVTLNDDGDYATLEEFGRNCRNGT